MGRLVINGEEVYELDEECLKEKREKGGKEKCSYTFSEQRNNRKEYRN